MKMKRIISFVLAVLMAMGTFSIFAFAAEDTTQETVDIESYLTKTFNSSEEKLATMTLYSKVGNYEIWCDSVSGEVGFKNTENGQILLTNPYSIGSAKAAATIKAQLLSQLIVTYTDNGTRKTIDSYTEAAKRGQIKVERIKNGIRVEYSIGNEQTRPLAPDIISKTRFESEILSKITDPKDKQKFSAFYALRDASAWDKQSAAVREAMQKSLYAQVPITKKFPVYTIDPNATEVDKRKIESYIRAYCPDYTFEQMDYDYEMCEYESDPKPPVNFRMALEYTIDDGDLVVKLPSNGILYNEEVYTLENIQILPYMGAGLNPNTGYTFIPDGSGALFKFEARAGLNATTVNTKIYGTDYAYQTITGNYEQTAVAPVFGIVENEAKYQTLVTPAVPAEGDTPEIPEKTTVEYQGIVDRGFFAIMEEGEAMASFSTYHGGATHPYNTTIVTVTPRPKDSYNLATAISVGSNSTWTVVSERRYAGSYTIRYVLLSDTETDATSKYDASWTGMAKAYRDYLKENGTITKLTDTKEDLPLYIETFGAMESIKKILSVPVNVMTALTTFEDVQKIYSELSADGISNINFKLTGYANGGMYANVPYKLKWEKAVGGKKGFNALLDDAKEKGYGVYPDFDFAYMHEQNSNPGVSMRKHIVKSIDNRYTSLRVYSAARQNYTTFYQMAMSPAYFYRFINKLESKYEDYDPIGISVATLGYSLNSDFDKKEPYNREDSKDFTVDAFKSLEEAYGNVMTSGGNAYTWKYADHILDMPLDSSNYNTASYSVPFVGYVLHGYKEFTGSPINMAGDIRYEVLKCIENGASIYFILSCDNTEILKEDEMLSKYYSIRYDIWYEDIVELYRELNGVLGNLQDKELVDHQFLIGERVLEEGEVISEADKSKLVTADDGRIVKVTYEDGTTFILNYNYFDVTVEGTTVESYGYVKVS